MSDKTEAEIGLNPLLKDTDGNGIPDNEETTKQKILYDRKEENIWPELSITGKGDYSAKIRIKNISINEKFSEDGIIVGEAYDFVHEKEPDFENAEITFHIEKECCNSSLFSQLVICYYDESNGTLQFLETDRDEKNRTLTTHVSHFSTYVVVNQGEYVRNLLDSYEVENALYFNGNAYFIINQEMTYTEAQEYCEKLGGKILRNPSEEEREFLSGNFAEGTTGENYFNLGNKEYRYYLKTEQKYRSGWLTNVVCSMDIHSEMPLFAIRFGTGKKDQNVPVTYYSYFAYGEDISKYQKYTVIEETNICMERYTWELSVSINPDGTSNVILRDKLYDIRNWEKETGNLFVITELSDPASINQYSGGAYTTYNTDIPIFDSFEDAFSYFKTGNSKLPVNQQQCQNFGRDGKKFFVCKVSNKESKETTECKIMLSTGEIITLNEDPDKGNMTTDTDGDGIADLLELVEKIPVTIPGTYESVAVWTYRSNQVKTDSDGDNITDREDPAPMSYNIMIENVYGNVVKLNTDAVWSIFGIDINKFYEHYYIRYDLFENREELESYKRILELNEQRYYTPEELAFLTAIDLNGVKDYLHYQPKGYMGCVYRALPGNEDIPAEEIQQIAEEYFYVKSAS